MPDPRQASWLEKTAAVVFVVLCFELGVFLLVFPWLDWWKVNWFSGLSPEWGQIWDSAYFRGAVSGLGLVDIVISFGEVIRLRRFAAPSPPEDF